MLVKIVYFAPIRIGGRVFERILNTINPVSQPESRIPQLVRVSNVSIEPTPVKVGQGAFYTAVKLVPGDRFQHGHRMRCSSIRRTVSPTHQPSCAGRTAR